MAKADVLAILNALSPRLGEGGSHVNKLDAIVKAMLDHIYTDIASGGGEVTAENVTLADVAEYFATDNVEAAIAATWAAQLAKYSLPELGIPASDFIQAVQDSLALADSAYQLPGTGVPGTDLAAAVVASLALADSAMQPGEPVNIVAGTPVNAVAGTAVLTIDGVAIHGETATIGDNVYEFAADAGQTVTEGNIAVDITAVATASQGTLTIDTQPTAGDTMTIGTKVYTFVPAGTANADGEVSIGADLAAALIIIVEAIDGTDGHNVEHTLVSPAAAFVAGDLVITAKVAGVTGDAIVTTETFTAVTNIFDAGTLGTTTPGVDCTFGNAALALEIEIDATVDTPVTAGVVGGVVTITAVTKGVAANAITVSDTMAHGVWGAGTLAGGVNGTVGEQLATLADATYLYMCIAANTIADTNWRRIALGSAY